MRAMMAGSSTARPKYVIYDASVAMKVVAI
jgi:hypothetical protein